MTAAVEWHRLELAPAIAELAQRPQWVLWRYGPPDEKGKRPKVPYQLDGSTKAKTNDPSTWAPYAACVEALERGGFDGLGYVFAADDPYVGVDLDHCLGDDGRPSDLAVEVVEELSSYTEQSPSGRGLHVILKGGLPRALKRDDLGVEVYSAGRYFTMTGRWWPDAPESIEERGDKLLAFVERFARAAPSEEKTTNGSGKIREGGRHNALVDRATWLRKRGFRPGEVVAALLATNAERCDPPLSEAEVRSIAAWSGENLEPDEGARPIELGEVTFSGARLLGLLERATPEPIRPGIPTPGHLTLEIAPPFTGKTSHALWCAMARAAGVAPWEGAPKRPSGRVLLFSLDEAPEQVARRMRSLALFHPAGPLERYAESLAVLGPDREVDPKALDGLRFEEVGLARVATWLREAQAEGRPFAEVTIDAYADVLPFGETENSNETATRIGGALERLAVETGAAITLLHHSGKPKQGEGELPDVTHLSRGASALAAKARVITSLEAVAGMPHLRRMRTKTNLGPTPASALFVVCKPDTEGESVLYFRPHDALAEYAPEDLLGSEPITTTDLARRIARVEAGQEPGGEAKRLATQLRERWKEQGRAVVREGPRGALLVSLPGAAT